MLDRRGFLKFIGGAAVGTLATPVVWQGLDDISIWSQNWGWIPRLDYGNNEFTSVRTVSKICPSAVGTTVRLVGGRPIRVVGDPLSPLSRGGVSALATTEVQLRYSPARLKRPLLRSSDGGYREISWDAAEKLLAEKLAAARKAEGKDRLVCISGDDNGTMSELFMGLAVQMGDSRFFVMLGDAQTTAVAWALMGGRGRAGFDFERSDYVLAVGANVLETWGTVISNRRAWGNKRPVGAEPAMRLAYAGPAQNNTAAGADVWLPVRPGTELYLLLGIARQLIQDGAAAPLAGDFAALRAAVEPWTPEKACAACGLPAELFAATVDSLKKAKAPLVIVGSDMDQGGGAGPARLGIAINLLLGRLNKDGGLRVIPTAPPVVRGAAPYEARMTTDLAGYALKAANGETPDIDVLMIHEANPLYALPGRMMEAVFKKSAFSVTFSCFFDETARRCDLILPAALGLERYDDVAEPFGFGRFIYTLARPVAEPLYEARPAGETLLAVCRDLGIDLGVASVVDMLRAKAAAIGADWEALSNGDAFVSDVVLGGPHAPSCRFSAEDVALLRDAAPAPLAAGQLGVAFVARLALGTPETGIPPFNTKTISDTELVGNTLSADINGATLRKLGLAEGSLVTLSNGAGTVRARLHAFEGVVNDAVALSMGFGHKDFDAFNNGKGMNVLDLAEPAAEPVGGGLAVWNDTRVNVAKA